ncbi:hypothetical protein [Microcoleus sp. FACHB-672]|uniref:hypothetical protein n=1 Tax=Microcoleus sp. FACHB-672 TaxID=2692825 RepID=UPI0018F04ED4
MNKGCPIHLVQATLGPSSIETTSWYLHANPSASNGLHLPCNRITLYNSYQQLNTSAGQVLGPID